MKRNAAARSSYETARCTQTTRGNYGEFLTKGLLLPFRIAQLARTLVRPDGDLHASADYRRLLVGVLTERTLAAAALEAAGRAA